MTDSNTNVTVMIPTVTEALELVKEKVKTSLSKAPVVIRKYTSHLSGVSGKFIRAAALLSSAQNERGEVSYDAVLAASAIELLHLSTLVHDDIIDDAGTRRGIITLHRKFGRHAAVICGDYLFCLSLNLLKEISNKEKYLDLNYENYMMQICAGELRQNQNNKNLRLTPMTYLKIISGKTAALFEASFYAGAVIGDIDEKQHILYRHFGRYVGMIFQLTDDCIDFEESEVSAKKPVQSDYEQGVITLPLIYALKKDQSFFVKASEARLTRQEINTAVQKTGGLDYTKALSKRYYDKALKALSNLTLTDQKRASMLMILDKAYYGLKK
jgi:heptaprenyl diphosphate synthase